MCRDSVVTNVDREHLNFYNSFESLKKNFKTFGVDPAKNIYKLSSKKHKILCEFFSNKTAEKFDEIVDPRKMI